MKSMVGVRQFDEQEVIALALDVFWRKGLNDATMQDLAGFTGIALQMLCSEQRMKAALEEQELLTREMGHRVKNLHFWRQALSTRTTSSPLAAPQVTVGSLTVSCLVAHHP